MLKIPYAGCLGLSQAISAQFALEMCVAAQNREEVAKTSYLEGSRSFEVVDLDDNRKGV